MADFLARFAGQNMEPLDSIAMHIQYLLNSRKDSLKHMPEFGITEYNTHDGIKKAKYKFINSLKQTIELFEPRVNTVEVEEVLTGSMDCILQIKIFLSLMPVERYVFSAKLLAHGYFVVGDVGEGYN